MQFCGWQVLGLHVPGLHVVGMHDGWACALFTVMVANTAGAVYAAALRKWRRARSSSSASPSRSFIGLASLSFPTREVYRESAPWFQPTGSSTSELCIARVRNCRLKYLLTTVVPKLYRRTVGG